jgi:lysyl-tRNA synthetase class 2
MSQREHIIVHKKQMELRAAILRLIREFFWSRGFLEMDPPALVKFPGQEPNLSPMALTIHNERGDAYGAHLHTSPEYAMKKLLAAGFEHIFALGKVYRDYESFGGTHNPEFTMIEWYRANADMTAIMDDCEALFAFVAEKTGIGGIAAQPWQRIHMNDAWTLYAGVPLNECLDKDALLAVCRSKGYAPAADERYEELFYRIFLNDIEPKLGLNGPVILHHYPAAMAALARLSPADPRYAERFEVYVNGVELANCFSELTDAVEQRTRLESEREERRRGGKAVFGIDDAFVDAVSHMPPAAGIALGVDRMVQTFASCQNIDAVLPFPASELFL